MRMFIVAVLAAVMAAAAQGKEPLSFKGLKLGVRTTPEQVRLATGLSCGVGHNESQVCNGGVTIAEARADANFLITRDGVLQRMNFHIDSEQFDGVFLALVERLGNPQVLKQPIVQNGFGAKFEDLFAVWKRPGGLELTAHRFGVDRSRSVINFSTAADRKLMSAGQTPKERAKDL